MPRARLVGPRLPGDKFYRKRPTTKKPRVMRRKATTQLIKQVLNRQLETKYVAVQQASQFVKANITPSTDFIAVLPLVQQQVGPAVSNRREGDVIEPLRARVSGHVWWTPKFSEVAPLSSAKIIYVRIMLVVAKQLKTYGNPVSLGSLPVGLLEDGTQDPVPWASGTQGLAAHYPVCKENYTILKSKTIKLMKNPGNPIAALPTDGGQTNVNVGKDCDRMPWSFSYKPPKLKYANDADNYPSNYAPFLAFVTYLAGEDTDANVNLKNSVEYNYNTEMYYKDA